MTDERDPNDLDGPAGDTVDDATEPDEGPADATPGPDPAWAPPPPPDTTPTLDTDDGRRWPRRLAVGGAIAAFGAIAMLAGGAIALAADGGDRWDDHDRQHHSDSWGEHRNGRR